MPTNITIKNMPSDLYDRIRNNAKSHRRSINNEVIAIFEDALRAKRFDPDEFLASVRQLREKTKPLMLTEAMLQRIKNEGRP